MANAGQLHPFAVCVESAAPTSAKTVPRSVRRIEPFGVGGGPDVVARVLAEPLSARWGRPVVVENHPGGGSTAARRSWRRRPVMATRCWSIPVPTLTAPRSLGIFLTIRCVTSSQSRRSTSQAYVVVAGQHAGTQRLVRSRCRSTGEARSDDVRLDLAWEPERTSGPRSSNLAAQIRARHAPAAPRDRSRTWLQTSCRARSTT